MSKNVLPTATDVFWHRTVVLIFAGFRTWRFVRARSATPVEGRGRIEFLRARPRTSSVRRETLRPGDKAKLVCLHQAWVRGHDAHAKTVGAAFGGGDCSLVNLISIFLAATAQVEAHAFVRDVQPGAGSTVQTSPDEVRSRFTENNEPA